mgnify:FL=1
MFSNNYFTSTTLIINRILDIPFALTALIYGLSSIYLQLDEKAHNKAKISFIIITLLIFLLLLYINLFVPDKASFNPQINNV